MRAYALKTTNRKTGKVNLTAAGQNTCPSACPLRGTTCYADENVRSFQSFHTKRLNQAGGTPEEIIEEECEAIRQLPNKTSPMRLHVVGDAPTDELAIKLRDTVENHYHGPVWSYTHAWRTVDRASWGSISVLASMEHESDLSLAISRGYAPALIVPDFRSRKTYEVIPGFKGTPCPVETKRTATCESCKLCWNDRRLLDRNQAILFHPIGVNKHKLVDLTLPTLF